MNVNIQYTFYLNQLYSENNPHSKYQEIEFIESPNQAEIRSFNQNSMKQILNTLIGIQTHLAAKPTLTTVIVDEKDIYAIRVQDSRVIKHFKSYLRTEFIHLQQEKVDKIEQDHQTTPRILSISLRLFDKIYPEFKDKIIKFHYKKLHLLEIYTVDYQAAVEIEKRLRADISDINRYLDDSLIWIDVGGDNSHSLIVVAYDALHILENICFQVSQN